MTKLVRISDETYNRLFDLMSFCQFAENKHYTFNSIIEKLIDTYEEGQPVLGKKGKKPKKTNAKKVV